MEHYEKHDIVRCLEDKITKGDAPTGLYDTGEGCFVFVQLGGPEGDDISFSWIDTVHDLDDVL